MFNNSFTIKSRLNNFQDLEIKALEEGTITKEGIPLFTIKNTVPEFYWITNFLETLLSTLIWKPVHSASLAYAYKKVLMKYARETGISEAFVDFQGHDFSFRGMQSPEAAIASGMGFLTSFKGTDTIPALQAIKYYYNESNAGFSVPASEHSVMCAHGKKGEIDTLKYLMKQYPKGILSVVSDTWDLWKLITEYLPQLKDEILTRDGKLVIRPDSGDPVDIICGHTIFIDKDDEHQGYSIAGFMQEFGKAVLIEEGKYNLYTFDQEHFDETQDEYGESTNDHYYDNFRDYSTKKEISRAEAKGVVELLWDTFGGTVNEQRFKVLDSHIGAIYGDSITLERATQISERLMSKGFASQVVLGIRSYSMGYATRDNQGGVVKSTYCEVNGKAREIYKCPITDNGEKKSAKGLVCVIPTTKEQGCLKLVDQVTWEQEKEGLLKKVFKNGALTRETSLSEIRDRISSYKE